MKFEQNYLDLIRAPLKALSTILLMVLISTILSVPNVHAQFTRKKGYAKLPAESELASQEDVRMVLIENFLEKNLPTEGKNQHVLVLTRNMAQELQAQQITWFELQEAHPGLVVTADSSFKDHFKAEERNLVDRLRPGTSCPPNVLDSPVLRPLKTLGNDVALSLDRTGPESSTKNEGLMASMFDHAQKLDKGFKDLDEMKATVKYGEDLIYSILNGQVLNPSELPGLPKDRLKAKAFFDKALVSIMWAMEAKAGEKVVLNPETWNLERGFVEGGTYRFLDGGRGDDRSHLIYAFLFRMGSYPRISSHYKAESLRNLQRGIDIEGGNPQLPGKKGTKTVLFGNLKAGQSFLKAETQGLNITKPMDSIRHGMNYKKHKELERKGVRMEDHAHRESTPPALKMKYKKYFQSELAMAKSFKRSKEVIKDLEQKLKASELGMGKMLESISNHPADAMSSRLKRTLLNYKVHFCSGEDEDPAEDEAHLTPTFDGAVRLEEDEKSKWTNVKDEIKGCEAIIDPRF